MQGDRINDTARVVPAVTLYDDTPMEEYEAATDEERRIYWASKVYRARASGRTAEIAWNDKNGGR